MDDYDYEYGYDEYNNDYEGDIIDTSAIEHEQRFSSFFQEEENAYQDYEIRQGLEMKDEISAFERANVGGIILEGIEGDDEKKVVSKKDRFLITLRAICLEFANERLFEYNRDVIQGILNTANDIDENIISTKNPKAYAIGYYIYTSRNKPQAISNAIRIIESDPLVKEDGLEPQDIIRYYRYWELRKGGKR